MRQNWSRVQLESLIYELEEKIDRLERQARLETSIQEMNERLAAHKATKKEGQLLPERKASTGTGAGGPPPEPASNAQAGQELGMGAKPLHGHCHHCDLMARGDPRDKCAGCSEKLWPAGIGNPSYTSEATYAEDMIQAEIELLQHISETKLFEDRPTNIPRSAQEEIAQHQASLSLVLLAEESAQTLGNEYIQLLDMQVAEARRSVPEGLVQPQYSTDEEDAYEDAYENYTTHASPWNPCRDSDDEGKEEPGSPKDDSVSSSAATTNTESTEESDLKTLQDDVDHERTERMKNPSVREAVAHHNGHHGTTRK